MSKKMNPLPMLATPKYELTLPSTGKKLKYRPFLVREEKILLLAMESGESKDMARAIRDIINECIEDKINIEGLPLFDVEYIFLQLRSKSVGEIAEPVISCPSCKEGTTIKLNLTKIKVSNEKEHTPKVPLTEDVGVMMAYPQLKLSEEFDVALVDSDSALAFEVIIRCIDKIWNGEELFDAEDVGIDAVREFVDNLTQDQFAKIASFFETMPQLKHDIDFICPFCQKEEKITLRGLNDFFESASATTI